MLALKQRLRIRPVSATRHFPRIRREDKQMTLDLALGVALALLQVGVSAASRTLPHDRNAQLPRRFHA